MNTLLRICGLCLILAMVSRAAFADEPKAVVFDGKTLDGWKVVGCEAEVQDGAILIKAGNGVVYPDQRFANFEMEYEWKALNKEKWDSGVYFRCELPKNGQPWPSRWQANLLKGQEGNVGGLKGATSKGLVKDGEWNKFKLKVVGSKASLEINGKPAWEGEGIEEPDGYICIQAEVPGGGQFLFRNISITPLK